MLLFNRYEYNAQTDIAGRGEFSRVYKAVDTGNQEIVAIKIYKINDLSDHYHAVRSAQSIKTLEHPGICSYYDIQEIEKEDSFGEKEKLQVCITSFLNGGSIVSWHSKHRNLAQLQNFVLDVLNGLSYLHKKQIIHGYIKPSNILINETKKSTGARITDFAMGIFSQVHSSGTGSQPVFSAVSYLSPEQLNANRYGMNGKISFNTDLWSLALVVYEALSGQPLFKLADTDYPDTISNRITNFERPADIDTLPEPFAGFLKRCLVKNAGDRAQTAEELLSLFSGNQPGENKILQLEEKKNTHPAHQPFTTLSAGDDDDDDQTRIIALPKKNNPPPAEEDRDDDATQIIARPVLNETVSKDIPDDDATQVIARPAINQKTEKEIPDEDATRIIARPAVVENKLADAPDEDATQVLARPVINNNTPKDIPDDDATQVIARPAGNSNTSKNIPDDDATQVIAKPVQVPVIENHVVKTEAVMNDNTNQGDKTSPPPETNPAAEDTPIDQTIIISSLPKDKLPGKAPGEAAKPAVDKNKPEEIIIRRSEKPVVLFNRYEYLPAIDLIGKGGFSRVYKAYDKKLSRWVALKIYKTGEFSDRYSPIAEIKRVVNLDHSNICRYLDIEEIENENPFGENEKIQVCVMELLDSGNFADYYKAHREPDILKKLVQDILNGLSYLHKNGIIHRDIKPANILIKQTIEGPVAKITDFGISKNSEAENNNSSSALIVSIPYMAPEQLNAKKYGINEKVSFNLDLWSLGVTIYEVFTGKVLFKNSEQDNSEQIMANIMAPEMPEKLNELPEPFKTIVSHCVIKNARERAGRAEELMVLLNTVSTPADTTKLMATQAANTVTVVEKTPAATRQPEMAVPKMEVVAPSSVAAEKTTKPRFSVAVQEERTIQINDRKKNKTLLITISVAIGLLILFIFYLKACNQAPASTNSVNTLPPDTAHKAVTTPVTPDTVHQNTATGNKTDTAKIQKEEIDKPVVHATEKKKETPVKETHKKFVPTETTNTGNSTKYVLLLSAETNCTLKVNSIVYGKIESGKPMRIYLTTGKYILQFISTANSSSVYTANIEVKPDNLGHANKFKVPLR